MQNTRLKLLINSISLILGPIILGSWRIRSLLILSILFGFYFTNSLISFFLDKSINTIFIAIIIVLIMELIVRTLVFSTRANIAIYINIINNLRIGSTYALILEAFKLGSWSYINQHLLLSLHSLDKQILVPFQLKPIYQLT